MPEDQAAFFARVVGRVQGVGFRYSCLWECRRLGLKGWVRNSPSGEVEVWAEGPKDKLERLRLWLKKGPPGAWVGGVHCDYTAPSGAWDDFHIRR